MIFRKNQQEQQCKVRIILAELRKLTSLYPNGDFSDQSCNARITHVQVQNTFVRVCLEIIPLRGCMANEVTFRPVAYLTHRYPIKNIVVYNQQWIYHPNIDLFTKKYAIPNQRSSHKIDCMPNSLQYTIKYLKFICIEPCMCYIPYNKVNMEAAIKFQRLKHIPGAFLQQMRKQAINFIQYFESDDELEPDALCDMSKTNDPRQGRIRSDQDFIDITHGISQLKLKLY